MSAVQDDRLAAAKWAELVEDCEQAALWFRLAIVRRENVYLEAQRLGPERVVSEVKVSYESVGDAEVWAAAQDLGEYARLALLG